MKRLLSLLCASLCFTAVASAGGKSPGLYVGIHAEGDEYDGPKMVRPNEVNGKTVYFRISPEVVTRHFEAFHAFIAEDGGSYGAALHLNDAGMRAMQIMCSTNRGRLARTIVNGRALDVIRIDKPGEDGYFVIWKGLTPEDIQIMEKKLKRLDEGLPGAELKKKKSR